MKKTGYILLLVSVVLGLICFLITPLLVPAEAVDSTDGIAFLVGFIAPSIVYFGNKIH